MPIESLINSVPSYEWKLKSKVQDKEEARTKRSIAIKSLQEEEEDSTQLMKRMKTWIRVIQLSPLRGSKNISSTKEDLEAVVQATTIAKTKGNMK